MAVPRYTSYPAVPDWSKREISRSEWIDSLNVSLKEDQSVSIYIHLPFCEQLCTYCACNKRITKNHRVESPYIDSLLKEWAFYINALEKKPKIKEIHLGGGTPTFISPEELERLISGILDTAEVADHHSFSVEVHPNTTTADHLKTLRKLGFNRLSIGVQDVDEEILKAINRDQTTDEIKFLTALGRELGYSSINYDLIFGLPFQTQEKIRRTMDFVQEMKPDRLAFYSYAHVPWKSKGQRRYDDQDVPDGVEKLKLKIVGEDLLKSLGYKLIGMDHYALETDALYKSYVAGELHRNFMGFTEMKSNCLIGLGCSSISESQDVYVQNIKEVEAYQTAIDETGWAVFRGHTLSEFEQEVRHHILNLMCRDKTPFGDSPLEQCIFQPAIQKMEEKFDEGLIILDGENLLVTHLGRLFIRNICADIDPNFVGEHSKRFSKSI